MSYVKSKPALEMFVRARFPLPQLPALPVNHPSKVLRMRKGKRPRVTSVTRELREDK